MTSRSVSRSARTLGEYLAVWRKLRELTMEQVAERANISRSTLYRIEHGNANVSFESVLEVLRALGILDVVVNSTDPLKSDIGRLRLTEQVPERVRKATKK